MWGYVDGDRGVKVSEVKMLFSPSTRLSDCRAALDSYGVELWKDGLLYLSVPLHWCELREPETTMVDWDTFKVPVVDLKIEVRMVRFEVPDSGDVLERIRERAPRWPFYVEYPMTVGFFVGDQWWEYKFTPGKMYEERRVER